MYKFAAVFLLFFPNIAAAQVKLAWHFKPGDRFFVQEITHVHQTITIRESEATHDLDETKLSRFAVLKADKDRTVLEQTVQSVKLKYTGEGPEVDAKVLKQMAGARFEVTLDGRGRVIKLTGYAELLKKVAQDDPLNAQLVRALMTEESFKVALETLFGFAPEKAVAKEDSWERKQRFPLGPLGVLSLDSRYTLEEVDQVSRVARLSMTSKGSYARPEKAADPSLKITGGEIRLLTSMGTLSFDTVHGRLLRSDAKSRLEGTLQVTIGGAAVTMRLDQEANRKIRVFEREPASSP